MRLYGVRRKGLRRYECQDAKACPGFGEAERGPSIVKSIEAPRLEAVALEAVLGMLAEPSRLSAYQAAYDAEALTAAQDQLVREGAARIQKGESVTKPIWLVKV